MQLKMYHIDLRQTNTHRSAEKKCIKILFHLHFPEEFDSEEV